jgi:hypothetical protein
MHIEGVEYITGMFRGDNGENMVTHLYKGSFNNMGLPMCSRGWQRKCYDEDGNLEDWEYSIFRNNVSSKGICQVCLRRAEQGLDPIDKPRPYVKRQL